MTSVMTNHHASSCHTRRTCFCSNKTKLLMARLPAFYDSPVKAWCSSDCFSPYGCESASPGGRASLGFFAQRAGPRDQGELQVHALGGPESASPPSGRSQFPRLWFRPRSWLLLAALQDFLDVAVKVGLEQPILHDAVFLKLALREGLGDLLADLAGVIQDVPLVEL